ncbi:MAG: efflux RND transporter periplasmic adaptor subunit [Alphaproteobacteria bacterium]|nr:efflux RND transporter periplasmic adaptor subunit [Alphaproteobacteria bacterium]
MQINNIKKNSYPLAGALILLLSGLAISLFAVYPASSLGEDNSSVPQIKVSPLRKQDAFITDSYVGYVTPIKSVSVASNVSGYIDEIFVDGGQEVKVGDNLLMIDQREYKAALDSAQAALSQAQANLNNASSYYNRIRRAGSKATSQTEQDSAKAKYLSALASVAEAKANLHKAQTTMDYTVLQSTIDGIIGNVALTKGNYVAAGTDNLLSIIQFNPIRVVFSITNKDYLNYLSKAQQSNTTLFANQRIYLKLSDGSIYPQDGEFKFSDNAVDKSTNSISVYADFANSEHKLLANSYVDVIIEKNIKDAYWIAQNFVYLTPQETFVYTVKDNTIFKKTVQIVGEQNGKYLISTPFSSDEYLIIEPLGKLKPGSKTKINIISEEKS